MAHKRNYFHRHSAYQLVVVLALTNTCVGAPAQQVNPIDNLTSPPPALTTRKNLLDPAPTTKTGSQRVLDYDYHDFRQPPGIHRPRVPGQRRWKAFIKPTGMAAATNQRSAPPINWPAPLAGMESIWGDRYEWIRQQVRKLHRHGLQDQLGALQEKFPTVNLTLLYEHYNTGGLDYDADESRYLYQNDTYQWQPYYADTEDGYWYNGTYYQGEAEVPEREDGYFYNGTWYAGEQEREDGSFFNGTYYPGEEDMADAEDGYYYNGTLYPGDEQDEDGRERMGYKGMRSWQQYQHPGWNDVGANNVHNDKQQPPSVHNQQQPPPIRKWEGHSGPLAPPLHQQQQQRQPHHIPGVPQRLPMVQQRPPLKRPIPFDRTKVPNRPPQLAQQSNVNPAAQQLHGTAGKRGPPPSGAANSETAITNNNNPGNAALTGNEPRKEQIHPSVSKSIPSAVSWGIVLAAVLGASVVLAPLACLLYKYRQEKRIKKRTFLKRPEHGSVDGGILDALVMSELGEKKGSRVTQVDKAWGRNWKREKESSKRSKSTASFRTAYELKPLPTSTTSAHVHDEPRVSIT